MSEPYLQTQGLTKDFGDGRGAIDIGIAVNPGEIVGFIGPNGAGKTTAIRMLMKFLKPDSGSLKLFGKVVDDVEDMRDYSRRIGFMPGEPSFYPSFTATRLFNYASELYGHDYTPHALKLARELDLEVNRPFKDLSLGNRKKVSFIHALMHAPDLIILDEPTSGMDPLVQRNVLNTLGENKAAGKAIFLSSHMLSEVQQVCDRIIMIKHGRIILEDTTKNILAKAVKIFRIDNPAESLVTELKKLPQVTRVEDTGTETLIYATDPKPVIETLARHNRYDFYVERSSLEDMFIEQYAN